jgi:hypothetical protein
VLKLSRQQMQGMLQASEPMFMTALERLVRDEYGAIVDGLPADLLRKMLARGCAAARRYGLQTPPDLAGFVMLMFEFGPQFHQHPEIAAQLNDARRTPHERLRGLTTDTPERVWREVEATLAEQRWFGED